MKLTLKLVAVLLLAGRLAPSSWAQAEPSHVRFGLEKPVDRFNFIEVKNFQDETLGRITDLGIDLVNGRIVEALVTTDSSLRVGNKVIAVPPLALFRDQLNEVYRLNVSPEVFASGRAIVLSDWVEAGSSRRVAAAYRLFGQEPYFLEEGVAPDGSARPKVTLGYVERATKILDLVVGNLQGQKLGKVWSMTLDIPRGRILTIVVRAPGNFKTMSIVPATALSFNSARDALLLDDTKIQFADEPRIIITEPANGQKGYTHEESYEGPHTSVPLEQGDSYRDVDRTVAINRQIRAAQINCRHVQVGTLNGRVTLRGWVDTGDDKRRIGEIAVAAARLELVDNQITVGRPDNLN